MSALNYRGFTLVEVLLSVAIISLLAGLTIPMYGRYQTRTDLDVATESTANILRRAQTYARAVQQDSVWSVRIASGAATLYKGTTFASRDTGFDETTNIPATFTLNWTGDINFAKLTGAPSSTAAVSITNTTNESRTITLNAEGMVDY